MGEFCQAAGIPVADRNFRRRRHRLWVYAGGRLRWGVPRFLSGVGGRVWDDPEGRVRLELQATRDAATVQQTYRETGAGGIQIAPPRSLTKPFGVINEVPLEVHVFTSGGNVRGPALEVDAPRDSIHEQIPMGLRFSAFDVDRYAG